MTTPGRPVKVEQNTDDQGNQYTTEWYVTPPPPEVLFTVTRDEWTWVEGIRVWRIYEIDLDAVEEADDTWKGGL